MKKLEFNYLNKRACSFCKNVTFEKDDSEWIISISCNLDFSPDKEGICKFHEWIYQEMKLK